MKTYFCSADVHGFYHPWVTALNKAGFDIGNPDHILVHCGDLLDRGQEAVKCLEFVNSIPDNQKILIRGNHEDLLEKMLARRVTMSHDYHNGTVDTMMQIFNSHNFKGPLKSADIVYDTVLKDKTLNKYLKSTVDYFEVGDYIFVHGWIPSFWKKENGYPSNDWRDADLNAWNQARWMNGISAWEQDAGEPGKTIVCGHWGVYQYSEKYPSEIEPNNIHAAIIRPGIIALDATTCISNRVNVVKLNIN